MEITEKCLSTNERVGTNFYIKINLTGFQSAVDGNKLLGNLHLTGLPLLLFIVITR